MLTTLVFLNRYAYAPELNDTLHLTGRGIQELKCLEPYVNVLSIHLTANAIRSLNGLQSLRKLRSLHISNNALTSLKGIEKLKELRFLDVSNNNSRLECIEGCYDLLSDLQTLNYFNSLLSLPLRSLERHRFQSNHPSPQPWSFPG